jgi:EAL domain-containing protein (putative c-di-GMP-specific phosphodiesterase class I)
MVELDSGSVVAYEALVRGPRDDVGADRASLALLPVLRPDVVKLDLRLVQERPTGEVAEIVCAVNAEAKRSGSVVLAEGFETEEHLQIALSLGATLGRGGCWGRWRYRSRLRCWPRPEDG